MTPRYGAHKRVCMLKKYNYIFCTHILDVKKCTYTVTVYMSLNSNI